MSPAKVECTDGHTFLVPDGQILDDRIEGFEHVPEEDQKALEYESIFGTPGGYEIVLWGRQDVAIYVNPTGVTSDPEGHSRDVELEDGNIRVLPGGTRIVPVESKEG